MSLKEWWNKLAYTETRSNAHFRIADDHIIDTHDPGQASQFVAGATYFEVRINQMFLRNQREYFREFVPLASVMTEFQFAGRRLRVPIVLGPALLGDIEKVGQGDRVEFLNVRLLGPCPYEGEDVELFIGLFRMVTADWAKRAVSLLESLTKIMDASKLSTALNVAGPLVDGVQGFIGMKDLEARLAQYIHYATPGLDTVPASGALRPGFEVLIREPAEPVDEKARRRFWVREGRLFHGESAEHSSEYTGSDFVLYSIMPLSARHDYATFPFHTTYWKRVEELLAAQKNDEAIENFKLLAADLVRCDDIVYPHRLALLQNYRKRMDEAVALYSGLFSDLGATRGAPASRGMLQVQAGQAPLGELDLGRAVEQAARMDLSPERALAEATRFA